MEPPLLQDWQPDPNTSYPFKHFPLEVQNMLSDADAIKNRWECKHRNFQTSLSPPDNLYHYTDAHGLHGIAFEPGQLWLTDYRSTNDPTEGKYVRTLLAE